MTMIRLYLDEDAMRHSLATALQTSGVDVATPLSDDKIGLDDASQLAYATEQGRVLYSHNVKDFARLHLEVVESGQNHAGIILTPQKRYSIGEQLRRLRVLFATLSAEEMNNRMEFLSNWG